MPGYPISTEEGLWTVKKNNTLYGEYNVRRWKKNLFPDNCLPRKLNWGQGGMIFPRLRMLEKRPTHRETLQTSSLGQCSVEREVTWIQSAVRWYMSWLSREVGSGLWQVDDSVGFMNGPILVKEWFLKKVWDQLRIYVPSSLKFTMILKEWDSRT